MKNWEMRNHVLRHSIHYETNSLFDAPTTMTCPFWLQILCFLAAASLRSLYHATNRSAILCPFSSKSTSSFRICSNCVWNTKANHLMIWCTFCDGLLFHSIMSKLIPLGARVLRTSACFQSQLPFSAPSLCTSQLQSAPQPFIHSFRALLLQSVSHVLYFSLQYFSLNISIDGFNCTGQFWWRNRRRGCRG